MAKKTKDVAGDVAAVKTVGVVLPVLPKLPKLPRVAKKNNSCGCGCGTMVAKRFAAGHDARLLGWAIRVERQVVAEAPEPHTAACAQLVAERAKTSTVAA